jgi:hypothetical protein
MKRSLILLTLLLTLPVVHARKRQQLPRTFAVGFYNLENLFDTIHDDGKNDYQHLPDGTYNWTGEKYAHKLRNMSRALADMGTDSLPRVGCAIIGVAEVENRHCLDDLVKQPPLAARGYRYVHLEGPDQRGIDCALLYQPSLFTVKDVSLVPYHYLLPQDSLRATRGFLVVNGTMAGEPLTVVVCHLPSRGAESYYREEGGRQVRAVRDSLMAANPQLKLLIMGDMNDDPQDPSMADCLGGRRSKEAVGQGDMYNPWWDELAAGNGTLLFQGAWNLFDQILLSPTLIRAASPTPQLQLCGHQVFRRDYLLQQEGSYKGSPLRTFSGNKWLNGYSDHLPTIVYLKK